jgi:hypothetical protein
MVWIFIAMQYGRARTRSVLSQMHLRAQTTFGGGFVAMQRNLQGELESGDSELPPGRANMRYRYAFFGPSVREGNLRR